MNRKILRLHQSTHININDCISDLRKNPDLKFLIINNCSFLTDRVLDFIPNSCTSLDISLSANDQDNITNCAIDRCLRKLKGLEYLNLSGRNTLDNNIFKILPKTLKSIVLPGKNALKITSQALIFLKKLPNLRFLYLNESSFPILDNCLFIQSLVHLDLSFSENITDSIFQMMPKNNNIKSLNMHGCIELTDFSLFSIAKKCKMLERFYISDCDNITNNGVEAIMKCEKLTCLTLSKCGKISDSVFSNTIKELNHLQKLNIIGCDRISHEILALLKKDKPFLQTYSNEAS